LVSPKEGGSIIGRAGSVTADIQQATGTKLHLSGRNEFYPGTALQEVNIQGDSLKSVLGAVMMVYEKLSEDTGTVTGGETDVEPGGARVKLVVPRLAATAVIGKGGSNIKSLRAQTGIHVHVEEAPVGVNELAEQVVSLRGSLSGVQEAFPIIGEKVNALIEEPWFGTWAASSHCRLDLDGAPVYAGCAKGKGKGKGKANGNYDYADYGIGYRGRDYNDAGFERNAGLEPLGPPSPGLHHSRELIPLPESELVDPATQGADAMLSALNMLPPALLDPADQSAAINLACPAECVSALIGKGGTGTREISQLTGTKIMVREIEGNTAEKCVMITGNVVGVTVAYLRVAARIASAVEQVQMRAIGGGGEEGFAPRLAGGSWASPGPMRRGAWS